MKNCADFDSDHDDAAIIRDDKKPVLLGKGGVGKRKISIYTSAGGLLQTIQVSCSSFIIVRGNIV
jgi:hypothetical protein